NPPHRTNPQTPQSPPEFDLSHAFTLGSNPDNQLLFPDVNCESGQKLGNFVAYVGRENPMRLWTVGRPASKNCEDSNNCSERRLAARRRGPKDHPPASWRPA